jgi:hypothetical protein
MRVSDTNEAIMGTQRSYRSIGTPVDPIWQRVQSKAAALCGGLFTPPPRRVAHQADGSLI